MYAKSLHIYGFKSFGKAELELQYPGKTHGAVSEIPNVNLILGDNGGGKSSVLRALAIAVLAPALLESGFVPYRLVRRTKHGQEPIEHALLKVKAVTEGKERELASMDSRDIDLLARIERRSRGGNLDRLHLESTPTSPFTALLEDDHGPSFFVAGYGATRRTDTGDFSESSARRSRGLRYQRVAGLFEDQITLRPLQSWLPRLSDSRRLKEVSALLNDVLPANIRFLHEMDREDDQFMFAYDGTPTPMSSLSDGFKAFIGWVSDLLHHLTDVTPSDMPLTALPGIVLLDEIDLHLHPEWQRSVVPTLARVFPKLQFVLTSHSPIIASTVSHENVFVTDTAEDGTATIKQLRERVYGRSAEQLLLSSYFGLQATRPESFQKDAEVLFQRAAKGDAEAALQYLNRLTSTSVTEDQPEAEGSQAP